MPESFSVINSVGFMSVLGNSVGHSVSTMLRYCYLCHWPENYGLADISIILTRSFFVSRLLNEYGQRQTPGL